MRAILAIVLIVCGTLLALAPSASNYLQGREMSEYLAQREDVRGVLFFRQPMGDEYRLGAWILGGVMIGLGALAGWHAAPVGARGDFDESSLGRRMANS